MKRRLHFWRWSVFLALFCAGSVIAAGPDYDLLIRNGKVIDGSGNPWFYGDVALKAARIVAVGRIAGEAKRTIDATGLVVAPGFKIGRAHV